LNPDTIRKLGALGLSLEQIAGVIEVMNAEADVGKEKARARWRKWKEGQSSNVGKRLQTEANVSNQLTRGDARGEDNLLPKKITGQEENKKDTPQAALESVLDAEHASALVEHRQKLRKPLTAYAARKLATQLGEWSNPNEAADAMLANGWQGFKPDWMRNGSRATGPPKPMSIGEMFREDARQNGILNDQPPANPPGRMETRNGDGEVTGAGDPRVIALTRNVLGGFR